MHTGEWITINEENFEAKFPTQPTYILSPSPDGEGGTTNVHNYILEPPNITDINFLYGLTYFRYPEGIIHHTHYPTKVKHFLDANVNLMVSNIPDGKLLRTKSTNKPTYAGRLLDLSSLDGRFYHKVHMMISESWLYVAQAITIHKWRDNDLMKKFLTSFSPKNKDEQHPALPSNNRQSDFRQLPPNFG